MMLSIPDVLRPDEVREFREALDAAEWVDGRVTAGYQSGQVKVNAQIPETHPTARALGARIREALTRSPLFISAALPLKIFPPLFNRYGPGELFGTHIDNAIRDVQGTPHRVRTDISATLFLAEPDSYDGGELVVQDTYGTQRVKLPAGHMVIYPGTSLHHVTPVSRGMRIASFFWIQSLIREDAQRALLFDLDVAIQRLTVDTPGHASLVALTGVYHNLLRRWADT